MDASLCFDGGLISQTELHHRWSRAPRSCPAPYPVAPQLVAVPRAEQLYLAGCACGNGASTQLARWRPYGDAGGRAGPIPGTSNPGPFFLASEGDPGTITIIFQGERLTFPALPPPPPVGAPKLPADGFPASPPFRPGNWDFEASKYTIASGDTLSGLSRLYLGSPLRWRELWNPNKARFPNPDRIPVLSVLAFPLEARDSAIAMLKSQQAAAPPSIDKPGDKPITADEAEAQAAGKKPLSTTAKVAIGVGVVGALGLGGYLLTRRS